MTVTSHDVSARRKTSRVQTICFHGIGESQRVLEPGEERFWITEQHFHDILDVIAEYPRHINITFDDSNASDAEYGLPGLVERGLTARFFVISDRIGTPGSLSPTQICAMATAGMSFGTHGASHRPWPDLAAEGLLESELLESAERISAFSGEPVDEAAFPQGLYNRSVLTLLRHLDFRRVYSVDEGWSRSDAWLRSRYSVIHTDTAASVAALLRDPYLTSDPWPLRTVKQTLKRWR